MSGNGYLELQNINMDSEAKKIDFASHFIRTTSIACSSEPQVLIRLVYIDYHSDNLISENCN